MELIHLGYLAVILILLFIIADLYRWMIMYKRMEKSLSDQNDSLVEAHAKACHEFIDQFEKYNKESVHTRKMVDDYTKMYQAFLDLHQAKYKNHV